MDETPLPTALTEAVAALWRIPPPGPNNLWSAPPFVRLREVCESLYPKSKDTVGFALANALRALGLPCALVAANEHLSLPADVAAAKLDEALLRTQGSRVYLCPLDEADELPQLKFGPNSIRKFTAAELEAVIDLPRLKRFNPNWTFEARRFSRLSWLVVEDTYREPGVRAAPWLSSPIDLNRDWGRSKPHRERFPVAVEAALFALLLVSWEDITEMPEVDWCGFRVPWVYKADDGIFGRPAQAPSPDTLSWEPDFFQDADGNVLETERPLRLPLKDAAVEASSWLNDAAWSELVRAHQSPLFDTPVAHFFVRAFLSEPLDEFLAHITTIEAALGLESDYDRKARPKLAKKLSATNCMAARVSALLGATEGDDYRRLFKVRSLFLHGRNMDSIPGEVRTDARRLAQRVVNGLIGAALAEPALRSRENYLNDLLIRGLG
jgi:hypothetical protein